MDFASGDGRDTKHLAIVRLLHFFFFFFFDSGNTV